MDDWQQLDGEGSRRVSGGEYPQEPKRRTRKENSKGEPERRTRKENPKEEPENRKGPAIGKRYGEGTYRERMFTFDSLGCSTDSRIEFAIYRSEFLHTQQTK